MSFSFCLCHPVAVNAFIICSGLCACTEMCALYVRFGSKLRPRTFGCVAMGRAVLFILRSRFLLYSAGSGVNSVQVVVSGYSVKLFCPWKNFYVGMVVCIFGCTRACRCDGDVICVGNYLNRCSGWWYVWSVNVE